MTGWRCKKTWITEATRGVNTHHRRGGDNAMEGDDDMMEIVERMRSADADADAEIL